MSAPAMSAPSRGFTLVELLVALVLFTAGVLGLAATTTYVVQQTTISELTTERSAAVQELVERLKATEYTALASGSETVGEYSLTWTVANGNRSKLLNVTSTGPGMTSGGGMPSLSSSVSESFTYRVTQP
jgi:type IV pilus assembly protein PilV